MTFDEANVQAQEWDAQVRLTPRANWVELDGRFSPEQLRAIADEVERRYAPSQKVRTDGSSQRHLG